MRTTQDHHRKSIGLARVSTMAAVLGIAVSAITAGAVLAGGEDSSPEKVVIGTGPHAVYVGSAPTVGGDPARGETEESYYARTGRHLPGLADPIVVVGPWWYGQAPVVGGDPASGETEASYFARTGRHLP